LNVLPAQAQNAVWWNRKLQIDWWCGVSMSVWGHEQFTSFRIL
jgi:hypothetical protein